MNKTEQPYEYFAFISYSSKDTKWGWRLQRKLEGYRMPSTLCSERGWERKPIKPVFFAPTDIQPGELSAELKQRLRASRHLIVICSPHSAKSEWVGKEIAFFHSLGRTDNIHLFIVDGVPHSGNPETECLHEIIEKLGIPERLGANIHEKVYRWPWMNKERAYVQLITKLLGVEFDTIWQRHKRRMIEKCLLWTVGAIAVAATIFGVWRANRPVDVKVRLDEATTINSNLPPLTDTKVTLLLDNDEMTKRIKTIDDEVCFPNIPAGMLDSDVRIIVADSLERYSRVDTVVRLCDVMTIKIGRNPQKYGKLKFRLLDMATYRPVGNCRIEIEGQTCVSDSGGHVQLTIPLARQRTKYKIHSDKTLANDTCIGEYDPDGFVVFVNNKNL